MTTQSERRQAYDRRRWPRGGRRDGDRAGYSPLVLVVDEDAGSAARSEAILATLRFAVAPAGSIDEALTIMSALRPNLVVAQVSDPERLRREMEAAEKTAHVPLVIVTESLREPLAMIEEIRRVLGARSTA